MNFNSYPLLILYPNRKIGNKILTRLLVAFFYQNTFYIGIKDQEKRSKEFLKTNKV